MVPRLLLRPVARQLHDAPPGHAPRREGYDHVDKSSTLQYQRDSLFDFCRYWLRFQFIGKVELLQYLVSHGRDKLWRRLLLGEALHKGFLLVLVWIDWRAALMVVVLPYLIVRWGLMMGNWGQHAFVDPADPNDPYRNSVTLVNCPYNHKMYNDGYHCAHHVKANTHWAEAPLRFEANLDVYAERNAVVFDGIRGFQALWVLLMLRRYDVLARHLVQWGDTPMSMDDRVAFLKARLAPVPAPAEVPVGGLVA